MSVEVDQMIAQRVHEVALKHNVSMSNICLAWQFKKGVAAPIIGVTKEKYLDDAVKCFDVKLSQEDVDYLEELYIPHEVNCNR